MAYYSSFQFGFQTGFQVKYPGSRRFYPNGNLLTETIPKPRREKYVPRSFEISKFERLNQEALKLKAQKEETLQDLRSQQIKIEEKELQRLRNLADRKLQEEILDLLANQQLMLLKLKELELSILRLQKEEEAIVILMLTMPF